MLGSDELYREWGYTAMSRHRDEARFYVAHGDLGLDRDHAPEPDALTAGLTRLLGRSRAQQLARENLPELDDTIINRTHRELHDQLANDAPPDPRRERDDRDALTESLDDSARRLRTVQAERDALGWYERRRRRDLDERINSYKSHRDELTDRLQRAREIHDPRDAAVAAWLTDHRAAAERLLELDAERRARRQIEHEAAQRLERLHRPPDVLPDHAPSLDLDLGLDP